MKKIWIILIGIAMLSACAPASQVASPHPGFKKKISAAKVDGALRALSGSADKEICMVSAYMLNFRAGPGVDHEILAWLPQGTTLEVLESAGDWLKVRRSNATIGYVHGLYCEKKEIQ